MPSCRFQKTSPRKSPRRFHLAFPLRPAHDQSRQGREAFCRGIEAIFTALHLLAHHRAGLRHGGVAAYSRSVLHQSRRRRRQAHDDVGDDFDRGVLFVPAGVWGPGAQLVARTLQRDRGEGDGQGCARAAAAAERALERSRLDHERHHLCGGVRRVHEHVQRVACFHDRRAGARCLRADAASAIDGPTAP